MYVFSAQDLLDSWVKEKTVQSIQPELDFFDEKWASSSNIHSSRTPIKQDLYSTENHATGFDTYGGISHKDALQMPGIYILTQCMVTR